MSHDRNPLVSTLELSVSKAFEMIFKDPCISVYPAPCFYPKPNVFLCVFPYYQTVFIYHRYTDTLWVKMEISYRHKLGQTYLFRLTTLKRILNNICSFSISLPDHVISNFSQTEYKLPFECTRREGMSLCSSDLNAPTIVLHMRLHVCGRNYPKPACLCGVNVGRCSPLSSPSVTPPAPPASNSLTPREICHYYVCIKIIQAMAARE